MEPQIPQVPPPPEDVDVLEGLARLRTALVGALEAALADVRAHGLTPFATTVRESIGNLTTALDVVLRAGGERWGLPARSRMVVISEEIGLEDLRQLAGDDTGQEPISLPPAVLRRLLALQDLDTLLTPAAAEQPATVDVFVNGVRCKPTPGRTQGGHRWLMADLPSGAVEVMVKARRPEPEA